MLDFIVCCFQFLYCLGNCLISPCNLMRLFALLKQIYTEINCWNNKLKLNSEIINSESEEKTEDFRKINLIYFIPLARWENGRNVKMWCKKTIFAVKTYNYSVNIFLNIFHLYNYVLHIQESQFCRDYNCQLTGSAI